MTEFERKIKWHLERRGFTVLKRGWPDFLCFDDGWRDGRLMCVEVKSKGDKLTPEQVLMHKMLKNAGIPVYVANEKTYEKLKMGAKAIFSQSSLENIKNSLQEIKTRAFDMRHDSHARCEILTTKIEELEETLESLFVAFDESPKGGSL